MIKLTDSVQDCCVKLSQGNPGALSVCVKLLATGDMGLMHLLNLDDMGMCGPSIWLGYKDFAKENLDTFIKALKERDPEMVRIVNSNGGKAWTGGRS